MDEIPVSVKLWRLFCYHGADEGNSEPYMWVIGFKFDGSTIQQQLARLSWTADLFFSQGSHGCLGHGDVGPGTKISIGPSVGTWNTTLKPITLTDGDGNTTTVPGAIAFIAVVLEENNVPDVAAEAGHQALNNFVASTLEGFVSGIDLIKLNQAAQERIINGASREQAVAEEMLAGVEALRKVITDGASDVVEHAMRTAMNLPEMVWAGIDKDEVMGRAFHFVSSSQLLGESDFTVDFVDGMFDKPHLPEAGDFAYNLHAYIKAKVRRRKTDLVSQLPTARDIQMQGISRGYSRDRKSFYIASVGGVVDGKSWWMRRSEACNLIQTGEKAFYVLNADGSHTPVLAVSPPDSYWSYLTTPGDASSDNNLLSLPKLTDLPGFQTAISWLEPDPFG